MKTRFTDKYLTPTEVMETLGWSKTFYYQQRRNGLPTIKFAQKTRHPERLIETWLNKFLIYS